MVLENDRLRVDVLPEIGARIQRFEHRASGADLLWHNPRIEPRPVPVGASYDDHFAGGWDELFPNDLAGRVGGEVYPDHGELWCQPWEHAVVDRGPDEVTLHLRCRGAVTTTTVEKWLTLRAGESQLRLRHRIRNDGPLPLEFLWKLHPALAVEAGDAVDVPARAAQAVDPQFGRVAAAEPFAWPHAPAPGGLALDLSVVPPCSGTRDFVYTYDLTDGWCAVRRRNLGLGFGLVFPREVFSSVWLFMSFGGWRGLETVVLEPCTTMPKDLNEAIRCGSCARLGPGEALECEVRAVLFEGAEPVRGFDASGAAVR